MKKILLLTLVMAFLFVTYADDFQNLLNRGIDEYDITLVKAAILAGADVNLKDDSGMSPFIRAIQDVKLDNNGKLKLDIVNYFVYELYTTKMKSVYGYSPLYWLVDAYSLWNAPVLDESDKNLRNPGLTGKERQRVMNLVKIMVERGADINFVSSDYNMSILMAAVNSRDPQLVNYLLIHGADPNVATNEGDTALSIANEYIEMNKEEYQKPILTEFLKIKELLLKFGAK